MPFPFMKRDAEEQQINSSAAHNLTIKQREVLCVFVLKNSGLKPQATEDYTALHVTKV